MVKKKLYFDRFKFTRRDTCWLSKLGEKQEKFLRKLVYGMNFSLKDISLPFDLKIISAEMIYRGLEKSWFHDKLDNCKLLVRLNGLDEEGIGMHLTETAKVIRWILWAPLLGDPNTSKQAPDRIWRESTYTNPADFLLSYIDDSKVNALEEFVAGRWDSGVMLGGADKVRDLVRKHISSDNMVLKKSIKEWLGFLKWHQDFDWEEVSGHILFGSNYSKLNVFWENEKYTMPEGYVMTTLWATEKIHIAQNIREVVGEVPGFKDLKNRLDWESKDREHKLSEYRDRAKVKSLASSVTVHRAHDTIFRPGRFRPDMPFEGWNKFAYENDLNTQTPCKNDTLSFRERKRKYSSEASIKTIPSKSAKKKKVEHVTNLSEEKEQSNCLTSNRLESRDVLEEDTSTKLEEKPSEESLNFGVTR